MSFNFQGPSERPIIQGAQNMMNNGGGGNLGYFQGRQKKKDKEKTTLFGKEEEKDSFTLSGKDLEEDLSKSDNGGAMEAIKGFLDKFKKPKSK